MVLELDIKFLLIAMDVNIAVCRVNEATATVGFARDAQKTSRISIVKVDTDICPAIVRPYIPTITLP